MSRIAAIDGDLAVRHLRGCVTTELLHAFDDVRDAQDVGVRKEASVRVERQLPRVVEQRVALDEATGITLRAKPHVLDLHQAYHGERVVHREQVDVDG